MDMMHSGSEWEQTSATPIEPAMDAPPILLVVSDTEEAFDWTADFRRDAVDVSHMQEIGRVQEICEAFGITPCYVIDYAVASQETGYGPMRALSQAGRAEIGAHLHPWVSPPFEEDVSSRNSYPGNLPRSLEAAKLAGLTAQITESIGQRPLIYKAGRYGTGPNTPSILMEHGYTVDLSPSPPMDLRGDGGPDFRYHRLAPYWIEGSQRLLCIPNTGGFVGWLHGVGPGLYTVMDHQALRWAHLGGIASRLGALERMRLSPEGHSADELIRLTDALYARGHRVFSFSFHSPSVVPGNTPYVRDSADLNRFLDTFKRYFDYFFGRLNGVASTPLRLRDHYVQERIAA